jgi:outer membrane lipoprotein LolB
MLTIKARFFHHAYTMLLALWVAGCAIHPPVQTYGAADLALQERLKAVNRWQIDGKLAVRTPDTSESARILWQQDGNRFDIHLSGPAGLKATHIYGQPGDVNFDQGEHHVNAESVEALSDQLTGYPLPASELTWWLRGLPAPPSPGSQITSVSYTAEGWLAELTQGEWVIRFSGYQAVNTTTLPGRMEATRGDTKIILIIKAWQVH